MIYLFFFLIIIFFHFYLLKNPEKNNISLFIFTIFYLLYSFQSYFFNSFFNRNEFFLHENYAVNSNLFQYEISSAIFYFYVIFCLGNFSTNFLLSSKNKFYNLISKCCDQKKYFYNSSIIVVNILSLVIFIYFYSDTFLLSGLTYGNNIRVNFGLFAFLKELLLFTSALLIFSSQYFLRYKICLFSFFVILLSFFTSDKDPLLYILIFFYYYIFFYKKISVTSYLLVAMYFVLSVSTIYFVAFFSSFRATKDLYFSFLQTFSQSLKYSGDPESFIVILYLLINDTVQIVPYNYFYNIFSFLPENLRINGDYGVFFAKIILGDFYKKGLGFSFNIISESIIYYKYYGILGFVFISFFTGLIFALFNKLTIFFFPKECKTFVEIYLAVIMSFIVVRSTSAGLFQFSIRTLVIVMGFIIIKKILKIVYSFCKKKK